MGEGRPHIPEEIKREVRRRSGFGCVLCGKLPYQYEHIIDYAVCREHTVDNIVLLCANCHQSVTAGRIPKSVIKSKQQNPYSVANNFATYNFFHIPLRYLSVAGQSFNIHEGQTIYVVAFHSGTVLSVRLEDEVPLFSAILSDFMGNPSLQIIDNEIIVKSHHLWDAILSGDIFRAKFGMRRVFLEMHISQGILTIRKLFAYLDGFAVKVTDEALQYRATPRGGGDMVGNEFIFPPGEDFNVLAAEGIGRRTVFRTPGARGFLDASQANTWFWKKSGNMW